LFRYNLNNCNSITLDSKHTYYSKPSIVKRRAQVLGIKRGLTSRDIKGCIHRGVNVGPKTIFPTPFKKIIFPPFLDTPIFIHQVNLLPLFGVCSILPRSRDLRGIFRRKPNFFYSLFNFFAPGIYISMTTPGCMNRKNYRITHVVSLRNCGVNFLFS
jgi:hypothetical protein